MSAETDEVKNHLPHHDQLPLCVNRLPYRQGRKLTAVKVYTVNNESNHLLVFGVPSLKLRQETKSLFFKFGKLLHFAVSSDHPAEEFTETYHVTYEKIQSARIAKKMLDTKNFYGGSLHICYAPEFESFNETRSKLLQRKRDVTYRLRNLQKDAIKTEKNNQDKLSTETTNYNADSTHTDHKSIDNELKLKYGDKINEDFCSNEDDSKKLYMGEKNLIYLNKPKRKGSKANVIEKRFKPCFDKQENNTIDSNKEIDAKNNVDIVDCTSAEKEVISNINEALNYNKFGNEIIKKVEEKPLNRIIFKCNKKS